MNAYKTIVKPGDDLHVKLPETFRNKKVEVIVLELTDEPTEATEAAPIQFATLPLGGLPFHREHGYDDDRISE